MPTIRKLGQEFQAQVGGEGLHPVTHPFHHRKDSQHRIGEMEVNANLGNARTNTCAFDGSPSATLLTAIGTAERPKGRQTEGSRPRDRLIP